VSRFVHHRSATPGKSAQARRALALIAVLLLSSCGDQFASAAAVVDGREISVKTLQEELDVLLAQPSFAREERKELTRQLLAYLIHLEIVRDYARANSVSVSRSEVERELAQTVAQFGGPAAFQGQLEAQGLTLPSVRRNIERNLLWARVRDAVADERLDGMSPTDEEKEAAFQEWLLERLAGEDVRVNPRFGRLNPNNGAIEAIRSTDG
jgi:foldase protein PrsA